MPCCMTKAGFLFLFSVYRFLNIVVICGIINIVEMYNYGEPQVTKMKKHKGQQQKLESFAFFGKIKDPNSTPEEITADIHFNLWTQCHWKTDDTYLDVGFIISNVKLTKELCFYIPFKVASQDVEDIGQKITNTETLDVIFNEDYAITQYPNSEFWKVTDESHSKVIFNLYVLDSAHDYVVDVEKYSGTLITIKLESIYKLFREVKSKDPNWEDQKIYFRFRIKLKCNKSLSFIREFKPNDNFLQSTVTSTYIIDFHYNSRRNMNSALSRNIKEAGSNNIKYVKYKKLHFFLMTKADVNVDGNSKPRMLEQGVWDGYVDGNDTKDIVAYHVKSVTESKESDVSDEDRTKIRDSWDFFAKIHANKSTWKIIAFYLVSLAAINIGCGLITNWIYSYFPK